MSQSFHPDNSTDSLIISGKVTRLPEKHYFDLHLMHMNCDEFKNMTLYKFYNINTLKILLKNKTLYIDRVNTWEDVYENFFLKAHFFSKTYNTSIDTGEIANAVFGQSWTYAPETDAMWRIYSQNKTGVRIQTNVIKLFTSIFVDDECIADTWLGKVEYNSEEDMNDFIVEETKTGSDPSSILRYLIPYSQFLKRSEFKHEKEFRIIKMLDSSAAESAKQYKRLAFKIDINNFIDSYLLDPRLDEKTFEQQKQDLVNLGADPQKISKSSLYSFKPLYITLD